MDGHGRVYVGDADNNVCAFLEVGCQIQTLEVVASEFSSRTMCHWQRRGC